MEFKDDFNILQDKMEYIKGYHDHDRVESFNGYCLRQYLLNKKNLKGAFKLVSVKNGGKKLKVRQSKKLNYYYHFLKRGIDLGSLKDIKFRYTATKKPFLKIRLKNDLKILNKVLYYLLLVVSNDKSVVAKYWKAIAKGSNLMKVVSEQFVEILFKKKMLHYFVLMRRLFERHLFRDLNRTSFNSSFTEKMYIKRCHGWFNRIGFPNKYRNQYLGTFFQKKAEFETDWLVLTKKHKKLYWFLKQTLYSKYRASYRCPKGYKEPWVYNPFHFMRWVIKNDNDRFMSNLGSFIGLTSKRLFKKLKFRNFNHYNALIWRMDGSYMHPQFWVDSWYSRRANKDRLEGVVEFYSYFLALKVRLKALYIANIPAERSKWMKDVTAYLVTSPKFVFSRWLCNREERTMLLHTYAMFNKKFAPFDLMGFFSRHLPGWKRYKLYLATKGRSHEWVDRRKNKKSKYGKVKFKILPKNFPKRNGIVVIRVKRSNVFFTVLEGSNPLKAVITMSVGSFTRTHHTILTRRSVMRRVKMERLNLRAFFDAFMEKIESAKFTHLRLVFKSKFYWYFRALRFGLKARGIALTDVVVRHSLPHHAGQRGYKLRRL